uniref:Uncharacterized protein n=1 Tax=Leersia perrieri TaxID=77586 RepID=A0A0D9WEI9_9ORYZ
MAIVYVGAIWLNVEGIFEVQGLGDGWPMWDFQKYIYGLKSFWPMDENVRLFEIGKTHWPCERSPHPRCKCGILATVGVVTSELGYGYYCGNAYGKYWEGRTCNWKDFSGLTKLREQLGRQSEPLKSNMIEKIRRKLRNKYDIPLPEREVEAMLSEDMRRHKGQPTRGYYTYEECITYWRLHREKYPVDLTPEEKIAKRQKIKEE